MGFIFKTIGYQAFQKFLANLEQYLSSNGGGAVWALLIGIGVYLTRLYHFLMEQTSLLKEVTKLL